MTTRRAFMQSLPVAGLAIAAGGRVMFSGTPAHAQTTAELAPDHFDPKGKAPSQFTLDVLAKTREALPFADDRDFEEYARGLIAPMPDLKIMADAGHVGYTPAAEVVGNVLGPTTITDPLAWKGKGELAMIFQNVHAVTDCLDVCKFAPPSPSHWIRLRRNMRR